MVIICSDVWEIFDPINPWLHLTVNGREFMSLTPVVNVI